MKIVAISDTHGRLDFKVPACDLLLHAGDICPDFAPGSSWGSDMQLQWINSKFANWLDLQPVENFYFTLGNHDFLRKANFAESELSEELKIDQQVFFRADNDEKIGKIWFSPWSNEFGAWAWMNPPELLERKYNLIPDDTNIIVSHQPPYGLGDEIPEEYLRFHDNGDRHVGSKELLRAIERVRPAVVICGHIHDGRGVYDYPHDDGFITRVYNVAMVNEQYKRVHEPVEIEF